MAFLEIKNIKICGFSACVPSKIEYNKDYPFYAEGEYERQLPTIGVEKRHIIEAGTTASDLCLEAAEKLIQELNWDKEDIQLLIYSSPARDYVFPDTACILQDRLGLSKSTMAFDMTLGCTGWSYAINVISSIMSANKLKKALLLNGNMTTTENAFTDKTAYPLFSDAGSATAIEYDDTIVVIDCGDQPLVLINPEIISNSEERIYVDEGEGCLSINREVVGIVPRYARVTMRAYDMDGNMFTVRGREELAVVFQHEFDHLNGIMFTDRIDKKNPFKDQDKMRAI